MPRPTLTTNSSTSTALQRRLLILGIVSLLLVFSAGVWWWQTRKTTESTVTPSQLSANQSTPVIVDTGQGSPTPIFAVPSNDQDQDGLTDDEEAQAGTSPTIADSDGDGLSDKLEVQTYHTQPLQSDSDGDGYSDGEEVKGRYNPSGSGGLIDPTTAIEEYRREHP